jgi:hypothetical protein
MHAILALGPAALLLSACASQTYNEPGVGFGGYDAYEAQRQAQPTGQPMGGFSAPAALPATSPYGLPPAAVPLVPPGSIASTELAAAGIGVAPGVPAFGGPPIPTANLGAPPPPGVTAAGMAQPAPFAPASPGGMVAVASSGVAGDVNMMRSSGVEASPSNAAPALVGAVPTANPSVPVTAGTGISDEQDFNAVSSRESIESDAQRRAQQAAQYQVVQPTALPPPPASTGPNIVEYALSAPNSKGQSSYSRFVFSGEGRQLRNCGQYSTPDEAQRDFLARGGPQRDPRGLDPDGDGFACAWDPAPFRAGVGRG